jgi:hypothetical protein
MRIAIVAGALLAGLAFCAGNVMAQADLSAVRKVENYYNEWLTTIPGVTAVDIGKSQRGQPEIEIHAVHVTDQIKQLPRTLNGFPVVVIRDASNPGEGSLGFADLGGETEAQGARSGGQSAQLDVNSPPVDRTDQTDSVAPAPQGAWTGPAAPTAPTAYNPIGSPQEGAPPQPEGIPPPALR